MAPVRTVEGERDRQEALLAGNRAGKMFHLTGGQHMTEDDGWISREMADRALRVAALKKKKKILFGKQLSHIAALPVFNRLENELNLVSKMGKHAERKVLYKRIVEEGGDINGPRQTWIEANKEELEALRNDPIENGRHRLRAI
jgi:hypothetical protein